MTPSLISVCGNFQRDFATYVLRAYYVHEFLLAYVVCLSISRSCDPVAQYYVLSTRPCPFCPGLGGSMGPAPGGFGKSSFPAVPACESCSLRLEDRGPPPIRHPSSFQFPHSPRQETLETIRILKSNVPCGIDMIVVRPGLIGEGVSYHPIKDLCATEAAVKKWNALTNDLNSSRSVSRA